MREVRLSSGLLKLRQLVLDAGGRAAGRTDDGGEDVVR